MRICLDFDGVIHDAANPVPGRRMGPPVTGALQAVELLLAHGHEVMIHSARATAEARFMHVIQWLQYYGFPEERMPVHVHKPVADVYIDDKALHFTDWQTALEDLEHEHGTARANRTVARADRRDRQRRARLPRS